MSTPESDPTRHNRSADSQTPDMQPLGPDRSTCQPFQNDGLVANSVPESLDGIAGNSVAVTKTRLVNRLNFINFQNGTVQVSFVHQKFGNETSLHAMPLPCAGGTLDCRWSEKDQLAAILTSYRLSYITIPAGNLLIKIVPEILSLDNEGIQILLPEVCHAYDLRYRLRQPCQGVSAQFIQSGYTFWGTLLDFTASSLRVKLILSGRQNFNWIIADLPVNIILYSSSESCYSGECQIQRHTAGDIERQYVLIPLTKEIQRYRKVKFRSQRQKPVLMPNIIFSHPLTGKRVELKVLDLSGLGFSVAEDEQNPVLLPGLIVPEIELNFADFFRLRCSVQVVYSKKNHDAGSNGHLQCGLAILDIESEDHIKLQALLHHSKNQHCYVCNNVDLDALWDFFFETGFIYPSKYIHIEKEKEIIKETYKKLYTRSPKIARHFIYQDNGFIMGHMGMIRFWENTWLIHHHAARKTRLNKAGLVVLEQMERLIYDSSRLKFMHMDYLICYYRRENKFPRRIFGGAFAHINNRKECSEDGFAFISQLPCQGDAGLPIGWTLQEAQSQDIDELVSFYEQVSGGLMLRALDLEQHSWQRDGLSAEYRLHGFKRERHLFSVKHDDVVKAIIVASLSDVGLNLSDLTHCLKVIVVDSAHLTKSVFLQAMALVLRRLGRDGLPVMVYPAPFVQDIDLACDKHYILWSVDIQNVSDKYFSHLHRSLLDRL